MSKASVVNDRSVKFSCFCGYLIKFTDKHIRWNDFQTYAKFCIVLIDWLLFVFMAAFKDCPTCFCPHWLLLQLEDTEKEMGACCPGLGRLKDKTLILQMGQPGDGDSTGFPQLTFDPIGLLPALHLFPLDSCKSNWPPVYLI